MDHSFIGLSRPEYIPSTEVFMSELAWFLTDGGAPSKASGQYSDSGIVYKHRGLDRKGTTVLFPDEEDPRREKMLAAMKASTANIEDQNGRALVDLLLDQLQAPVAAKAVRVPAIPLTVEIALLQDRRGVTGKKGAANIGLILEKMNQLGGGETLVSRQWANCIDLDGSNGLPPWMSAAFSQMLPEDLSKCPSQVRQKSDANRCSRSCDNLNGY